MWGGTRLWKIALVAAAALGAACDKSPFEDEPTVPQPGPPPHVSGGSAQYPRDEMKGVALDVDAGFALDPSDPLGPPGDLRADVDGFTTLDACVTQRSRLDPVVADAVRALGYDTLLRDACRVVQALKMKDPSPCAAITASGLQARCESLVAMAKEEADRCPWQSPNDRSLGREAFCTAVATHDPRGCAAAPLSERLTCEALASGDVKRCDRAIGEDRRACLREMIRDRRLLVPSEHDVHDVHDVAVPKGKVEVHGDTGTADPPVTSVDLASQLAAGTVIAANPGGGTRVDLARDREAGLRLPLRSTDRTRLLASVVFDASGTGTVEHFEVDAPNAVPLVCPGVRCRVKATVAKLDAKRGAPIAMTFDATVDAVAGKYVVHAQLDSFVRDVVTRTAMYSTR